MRHLQRHLRGLDSGLHDVDAEPDYDTEDRVAAMQLSMTVKTEGLQAVGLIYQAPAPESAVPGSATPGPSAMDVSIEANEDELRAVMEGYRIY